ncbi:MAG: contractile injection system tape measure protein [Pseudomonadota bacterium]
MTAAPLLVGNAGLVLTTPFLPHLFALLDLTTADDAGRPGWRSPDAQARAVRLTQMLVDGRDDSPEAELVLNRLLCGMPDDAPVAAIVPDAAERDACHSLLTAMLANWPALSGSSPAALQETFLQREGRIGQSDAGPKLTVERKTFDVVLASIGWSYSLVLHP